MTSRGKMLCDLAKLKNNDSQCVNNDDNRPNCSYGSVFSNIRSGRSCRQQTTTYCQGSESDDPFEDDYDKDETWEPANVSITSEDDGNYPEGISYIDTAQPSPDIIESSQDGLVYTQLTTMRVARSADDERSAMCLQDKIFELDPTTEIPTVDNHSDIQDEQTISERDIGDGKESMRSHENPSMNFNANSTDSSNSCNLLPPTLDKPRTQRISVNTDENDEVNPERNCKKRARRPDTWKDNKKKMKRNSGQSYSTKGGKIIDAKKMKPTCNNCRIKCAQNVPEGERITIFHDFWKLGNIDRQRDFIVKCMSPIESKSKKEGSKRQNNFSYHFEVDNTEIKVCKKYFLNTLAVSERYIYTSWRKRNTSGFVEADSRGRHGSHRKIDEGIKNDMRMHIDSFPAVESHYLRAQTNRKFIDGNLCISEMYRLYLNKCEETGRTPGKQYLYENIFNTEFNIGFFKPKKDQCSVCESFKNLTPQQKSEEEQRNYDSHQAEKNRAREEKKSDLKLAEEGNGSIRVFVFDLQAVLTIPAGEVSTFYYKRKLSVYNFTVYDIGNKDGYCFMWDESLGGRGANEIGSCVLKLLQTVSDEVTDIIFYSDNCGGQNKNKYLLAAYAYILSKKQNLRTISHKYLTVGHTQNEGDTMHSLIEKNKARALKSGPIYVPSQMVAVVKLSKKTGKPYSVTEMQTKDFYDFKGITQQVGSNFNFDEENEKIVWHEVKEFKLTRDNDHHLLVKTNFDSEYRVVNMKRRSTRSVEKNEIILKNAYIKELPKISVDKKKDLLQLCEQNHIPATYHSYFQSLRT